MVRRTLEGTARRWALVVGCVPLVLLTGCPQNNPGASAKVAPQATAPAVNNPPAPSSTLPATIATPTPAAPQADTAANAAKIQRVINDAERMYRSGVSNYQAGRLDAARLDFDSAVDAMLTSGLDLKSNEQLSDEFTHILDAVNSLEMSALKQGNGFSPKLEAAPLDAANEVTFPPNAELTAKVAAELKTTQSDFPLVVNDYVAGFISYFSNSAGGHAHLLRSLERAGKYKDMISQYLREEGVPQDLIYLAVAESGFQPQALNARSGAGGMWQFMPTGAYGLARNGWFDERFDPEKSSRAYAKYMKMLYDQFGDWYLAMAAYDWGPGNVQRAVMRTGYADFWELYRRNMLPAETKNYVPGIIAAIIMAKNPKQYGLDIVTPESPVVSDQVTVGYAVDLRLVADVTGAPLEEIVALNPSLLRMTTPRDMDFDLHIPVGTKDAYLERINQIPEEKRTTWRFHVVKPGETLDGIATAMHVKSNDIATLNGITIGQGIDVEDELVIPIVTATSNVHAQHYIVRSGDSLVTVADRFNVSVDELRRWNHLTSNTLRAGTQLNVAAPVKLAPATRMRTRRTSTSTKAASTKKTTVAKSSTKSAPNATKPKTTTSKSSASSSALVSRTKSQAAR